MKLRCALGYSQTIPFKVNVSSHGDYMAVLGIDMEPIIFSLVGLNQLQLAKAKNYVHLKCTCWPLEKCLDCNSYYSEPKWYGNGPTTCRFRNKDFSWKLLPRSSY